MGIGDRFPTGNGPKKPLTKKQLQKMREAYAHAEEIAEKVRIKEEKEKKEREEKAEEVLKTQFL
ncbi:hypothetical protein KGV55_01005 [Candidatus Gracilibacteria bacterium]|nr:hypothetical protein [Candidatus Gracilibacteria bacterium]